MNLRVLDYGWKKSACQSKWFSSLPLAPPALDDSLADDECLIVSTSIFTRPGGVAGVE